MRDTSFRIHDRFQLALRATRIHTRTRLQENGNFSKLIRTLPSPPSLSSFTITRAACPPRGLAEPKALRWRATLRSRTPLAARSAICAATPLDVNGHHDTPPVASHAAAQVSPPIPTVAPRPVLLQWRGAHGVVSLACASNRARVVSLCIPGATLACRNRPGYCVAGIGDALGAVVTA